MSPPAPAPTGTATGAAPAPAARRVRSVQMRVAVGMTALALGTAALVALGGFLLASRLGPDPQPRVDTRLEQVGDRLVVVQVEQDTSGARAAEAARRDALVWVLAAVAGAFLPAAALAWVVAGRVLRPVQRLTQVVENVESPDGAPRSGVERDDELGDLAASVDRMLDRLEVRTREQQHRLHEVIHELRTPLAVAGTNLELARGTPGLEAEAAGQLDAARRAVERMGRTVDDLANHGRLSLPGEASTEVDVAAAGRELVDEHRGAAAARGLTLSGTGPEELAALGDAAALRTAAGNLVANALRLAPAGSTVTVRWGGRAGWSWLAVTDEGPGIAPADQARVFDRYWQGRYDRARSPRPDGPATEHQPRGIGLTIARQVVEAQGGRITLRSHEGAGSTFTVWLPASADAAAADVTASPPAEPAAGDVGASSRDVLAARP